MSDVTSTGELGPEEASERLNEILRDFIARRHTGLKLLVKSPPGLGKTTSTLAQVVSYQLEVQRRTDADPLDALMVDIVPGIPAQMAVYTLRHDVAREVQAIVAKHYANQGKPVEVPILRGRTHKGPDGRTPCQRPDAAADLAAKGLPIFSNLCRRAIDRQVHKCPHFDSCEYIRTQAQAFDAPVVILLHAHLGLAAQEAEWTVKARTDWIDDVDDTEGSARRFHPANVSTIICDEDPTQRLLSRCDLPISAFNDPRLEGIGAIIVAGLRAPEGLLRHLRQQGVTPDRLSKLAVKLAQRERGKRIDVHPSAADAAVGDAAKKVKQVPRLSVALNALADELRTTRNGEAYSLSLAEGGQRVHCQHRKPWPFPDKPVLVLDGTANADILRQFIPDLDVAPEIVVRRNARIVQVKNGTFSKVSLIGKPLLAQVGDFIAAIARERKTLVVTNKAVRRALTGEPDGKLPPSAEYRGAEVGHFGNIRGVDAFKHHEAVIVVGRNELKVRDAEREAKALWYDTQEPIHTVRPDPDGNVRYRPVSRPYVLKDHTSPPICGVVNVHPDPRVQAVVELYREAETVQAIDRLRLIHNPTRKEVFILCDIPIPRLPIDELAAWDDLRHGGNKLERALQECDAKGWDALPLAKEELSRLFLHLWATPAVAGHWLDRNPTAIENTISKWGFIVRYKTPGQRGSGSRAAVRKGADPAGALKAVLGVAVRVQEPDPPPRSSKPEA